jgi:hypothetical protein
MLTSIFRHHAEQSASLRDGSISKHFYKLPWARNLWLQIVEESLVYEGKEGGDVDVKIVAHLLAISSRSLV